jgi:hypothetical protein
MSHAINSSQELQMLRYVNNQQVHFSIRDVFNSKISHQHVSGGIPAIRSVMAYKVKVKVTLEQALRLCTGCMAHRGSRGIALLFL